MSSASEQMGTAQREALDIVRQVDGIRLKGALSLFVLDAGAIWDEASRDSGSADRAAEDVLRKLGLLARQEGARIFVRGAGDRGRPALEQAIPAGQLVMRDDLGPADLHALLREQSVAPAACIAFLAVPGAQVPAGCTAFFLGPGEPPTHAHATRLPGSEATDFILALYGAALAQERAGLAFRSASQGGGIPVEAGFPPEILTGLVRSAARPPAPTPAPHQPLPDEQALRALARKAYALLVGNLLPNGAVVAAPARGERPGEPNYWFFWQRDSAAAMDHLIEWHQHPPLGLDTSTLALSIERYVGFIAHTQTRGPLGTSRYSVDGEPILGYGNPQLDGPALTALTLTRLADPSRAYDQIRAYLDFFLTPDGRGPTMDAWEFIFGRAFNAEFLERRALQAGARIADELGHAEDARRYRAEAQRIGGELAAFVDERRGRLVARRETENPWLEAISGLDMAVIGALLAGWGQGERGRPVGRPPEAELGRTLDSLAHPAVLETMRALEAVYESLFQVNRDWRAGGNSGWGIARFPEDANDGVESSGGNPWPLTTLWAAQFYYRLAQEVAATLENTGPTLMLDDARQVAFFNAAAGDEVAALGRPAGVATWRSRLLPALVARGDAYLAFVVHHVPDDGGVTEQIDRDTGAPRGAPDLSWALSELVATIALREEVRTVM